MGFRQIHFDVNMIHFDVKMDWAEAQSMLTVIVNPFVDLANEMTRHVATWVQL